MDTFSVNFIHNMCLYSPAIGRPVPSNTLYNIFRIEMQTLIIVNIANNHYRYLHILSIPILIKAKKESLYRDYDVV